MADSLEEIKAGKLRDGVPDIRWTTEYAQLVRALLELLCRDRHDVGFLDRDVPDRRRAHHGPAHEVHGPGPHRLRLGLGLVRLAAVADRAFWRFQIPEELRKKYGYPELTRRAKRKILGLNSARLYGIKASGHRASTSRCRRTMSRG